MNAWEWVHIIISALGGIVATLVLFLLNDIRDRIVRSEDELKDLGERLGWVEGAIGKGWNGQERRRRL